MNQMLHILFVLQYTFRISKYLSCNEWDNWIQKRMVIRLKERLLLVPEEEEEEEEEEEAGKKR